MKQDVVAEFPADIAARILPPELKKEGKGRAGQSPALPADLTEGERAVLKFIPAGDPAHIDELAAKSSRPVHELAGLLLGLEMRDLIRQLPGKCFVRKL